jgi:hypothetical protein
MALVRLIYYLTIERSAYDDTPEVDDFDSRIVEFLNLGVPDFLFVHLIFEINRNKAVLFDNKYNSLLKALNYYHHILSFGKRNPSIIIKPVSTSIPNISPLSLALPPFNPVKPSDFEYDKTLLSTSTETERGYMLESSNTIFLAIPSSQELLWIWNLIKQINLDIEISYSKPLIKIETKYDVIYIKMNLRKVKSFKDNSDSEMLIPYDVIEMLPKRPFIPFCYYHIISQRSLFPQLDDILPDSDEEKTEDTNKKSSLPSVKNSTETFLAGSEITENKSNDSLPFSKFSVFTLALPRLPTKNPNPNFTISKEYESNIILREDTGFLLYIYGYLYLCT